MKTLLVPAVVGAVTLAGGAAQAQWIGNRPNAHESRVTVEVHGVAHHGYWRRYGAGFGAGFRVDIPLLPNGPLPRANNSLALSLGADLFWYDYYRSGQYSTATLVAPVVAQWNFYLFGSFSVFAELGGAVQIFDEFFGTYFLAAGGVGGRVHFGGRGGYPTLTFRFGFPVGFTLGATF